MLAAGSGTRFWPMTEPKDQFSFLGQSLIERNLLALKRAGVTSVLIIGNPTDEAYIRTLVVTGMKIQFAVQKESLGMADALLSAKEMLSASPILVMNAEDLIDHAFYAKIMNAVKVGEAFVVGRNMDRYFDGGYLVVKDNRLTGIVEKPGEGNEPSKLINLVYHFFPDASVFIKSIEETISSNDDVYEQALANYLSQNVVRVLEYGGFWYPLKYSWHVLDIMEQLLKHVQSHQGKNVTIKNNVTIEGNVWIGDNVKIFENSKITGPCFIGDNSIIGNNSMIRESVLGNGCITGFNTDITRSYIGDNCWFHTNYVGDSVFEGNISMGSGAKTANLRLDEGEIYSVVKGKKTGTSRVKLGAMIGKDVRIGVNASIMPGVKIGSHSFVGSGVILDNDLPDGSFCTAKAASYEVKKNLRTVDMQSREQFKKAL